MSKIQWTNKTWNVITGCTQISPACDNCYAKAMTKRLQGMAKAEFKAQYPKNSVLQFNHSGSVIGLQFNGEDRALYPQSKKKLKYIQGWDKVVFHKECLNDILDKKKYPSGSKIFVNSMSDTFHMDISDDDLVKLFYDMSQRQDLIFQVLTKRAYRILDFFNFCLQKYKFSNFTDYLYRNMCKHIWFGVTAENQEYADKRIPKLLKLKDVLNKNIKCFVSIEPCLEDIDLSAYLDRLDWVIIGGEKIPNNPSKARLMEWEWVDSIYNQCKKERVPFFFKQWGNNPTNSCHTRAESCMEFPRD